MATTSSALKPKATFPTMQSIIAEYFGKEAAAAMPGAKVIGNGEAVKNDEKTEDKKATTGDILNSAVGTPLPDYALLLRETSQKQAADKYSDTVKELENYLSATKNEVNKNYDGNIAALDETRRSDERNLSLEYEKLLKYLPEYIENAGLEKLGVAQSTLLAAKNDYISSLGEIAKSYGIDKAEYTSAKDSSISSVLKDYYTKLTSAENEKLKADSESDEAYNKALSDKNSDISQSALESALTVLKSGSSKFKTPEQKLTYINSLKQYMTVEDWQKLVIKATEILYSFRILNSA